MSSNRNTERVWMCWLGYLQHGYPERVMVYPAALRSYRRWETLPLVWREALIGMERPAFNAAVAYVPLKVRRAWWKRVVLTRELRGGMER